MRLRRAVLLALIPVLAGSCSATTDRDRYASGDAGSTTFANDGPEALYLEGCSAYAFEQLLGERWVDRGPAVVCVWEGFAQPVAPGARARFDLLAPQEPGTWRLRYTVGFRCDPAQPLREDSCAEVVSLHTPPFLVQTLCEPSACGPPLGMPNVLCPDGEHVAGPTDRCLLDSTSGLCGWEILSCPE